MTHIHILSLLMATTCTAIRHSHSALSMKDIFRHNTPAIALAPKTFVDLAYQSNIFSDKTLLIKELLENTTKTLLIAWPPRFAKSINLDMIRTFLQMALDNHGNQLPPHPSMPTTRLFLHGQVSLSDGTTERLKRPLSISKYKHIIDKYLSKYLVIFVNFSSINGTDFATLLDAMAARIRNSFKSHNYLVQVLQKAINDSSDTSHKSIAQGYLDQYNHLAFDTTTYTEENVTHGLQRLSEILHYCYNTPVFILIDEYDAPSNLVFSSSTFPQQDLQHFLIFFSNFLSTTFQNNTYLEKGILSGTFPLPTDLASSLPNITEYTFVNGDLVEFYGIDKFDLDVILESIYAPKILQEEIFDYYDGFYFVNDYGTKFNPHFIANAVAHTRADNWVDVRKLQNIYKYFFSTDNKIFTDILNNVVHKSVSLSIQDINNGHFTVNELQFLLQLFFANFYSKEQFQEKLSQYDPHQIIAKVLVFLHSMGYLSHAPIGRRRDRSNSTMLLKCVNRNTVDGASKVIDAYLMKEIRRQIEEANRTTIRTSRTYNIF